jgi:hypothetical protein
MTPSLAKKIACIPILGVAVLALGLGVRGCRNPGEGSAKLSPEVRARLGKGPESPWARGGKTRALRQGVK